MQQLDDMAEKIHMQRDHMFAQTRSELQILRATLEQFNPNTFLEKGFTLVLKEGRVIKSVQEVTSGDKLEIVLRDGKVQTRVE
jgi:exodeoxyribonuclease VII large subunit